MLRLCLVLSTVACIKTKVPYSEPEAPNIAEAREQEVIYRDLWDRQFSRKLENLPRSGEASVTTRINGEETHTHPYSGHWYPEKFGGTARVFNGHSKSALHKYDEAFNGGQLRAVAWERKYHSNTSTEWMGHCNGFAAASQRYLEPHLLVKVNDVVFRPEDIKTLLVEIHVHARTQMLGGRRCDNRKAATTTTGINCPSSFAGHRCVRYRPHRSSASNMGKCEDVNPGTFHLALANWVGKRKQVIIFDKEAKDEVWNYPLFRYQIDSRSRRISRNEALGLITPDRYHSYYLFNTKATTFYHMITHVYYTDALLNEEAIKPPIPKHEEYTYILELDDFGEIIGGEWIGESHDHHPDFLWIALEPLKSMTEDEVRRKEGITDPNELYQRMRRGSNPYIDPIEVNKLWAKSVGYDQGIFPPTLAYHVEDADSWGRYSNFDLIIDGNITGTVFLGKKIIYLDVVLKGQPPGNILHVKLNGTQLASSPITNHELKFNLTPRFGINTLSLNFENDPLAKKVIFHAVPP